jgi:hypothetical protein
MNKKLFNLNFNFYSYKFIKKSNIFKKIDKKNFILVEILNFLSFY